MPNSEILIIGSGIAGLTLALKVAQKHKVAIVTKRDLEESNTRYSQGGIAAVVSSKDSISSHIKDTFRAGGGLCKKDIVERICSRGPRLIKDLRQWGVDFSLSEDQEQYYELGLEGGHSHRRILHAGDITGREIQTKLCAQVRSNKNIRIYEHHIAVDVITQAKVDPRSLSPNTGLGAYVLNIRKGKIEKFLSQATVLATGGAGKVYLYTTNPDIAAGDGVAMAFRAGAPVSNLEFVQFHPTCLYHPKAKSFLISEAVRGEGGKLLLANGKPFMQKHHPLKELAPRDIVARAIDYELKKSGDECVYLDISHRGKKYVEGRFPNLVKTCREFGIDLAAEPVPVVPAAHYFCGGVQTDISGSTAVAGLYVIGESAHTGLHGANRLASNSLLEGLVMADECTNSLSRYLRKMKSKQLKSIPDWNPGNARNPDEQVVIAQNWDEIRRTMWNYVGIVRTDKRLDRALRRVGLLQREIRDYYWDFIVTSDLIELRNLALVAELIIRSALYRKESRGLHTTLDYPKLDNRNFNRDTVIYPRRLG